MHFLQMFKLDGKPSNFSENDQARLNTIANLLDDWGLVEIINKDKTKEPVVPVSYLKIVSYKDKKNWNLQSKYSIGTHK